jgi:hypothetical protein
MKEGGCCALGKALKKASGRSHVLGEGAAKAGTVLNIVCVYSDMRVVSKRLAVSVSESFCLLHAACCGKFASIRAVLPRCVVIAAFQIY